MRTLVLASLAILLFSSFKFESATLNRNFDDSASKVNFRIQLCEYRTIIPVKKVELLRQIGAVPVKSNYGSVYITQPYASEQDAEKDLPKFRALGFEGAAQIVEIGDELISIDNYHNLYQSKESAPVDQTKHGVVRIWK